MKKYSILLLPFALVSLLGCKNGSGVSQRTLDLRKAENLKYDSKFADKLVDPLSEDQADFVREQISSTFEHRVVKGKVVSVRYDEESYAGDHIIQKELEHEVFTLYTKYSSTLQHFQSLETNNTQTGVKTKTENDNYIERFDDPEHSCVYDHYRTKNGSHYLSPVYYSGDAEQIESLKNERYYDLKYKTLDNCLGYEVYVVGKKYVLCYDDVYPYYEEATGITYETELQSIFEFNSKYQLVKGSVLYNIYADYDFQTEQPLTKKRLYFYKHELLSLTYGNRKDGTGIANENKRLFSKPYFDNATMVVADGISDCRYFCKLQELHLEGYVYYEDFQPIEVDVTPYVYSYANVSMYSEDQLYCDEFGKLTLNSKQVRRKGNAYYWKMKSSEDAILYKFDFVIKNNEIKFKSGSISVKPKAQVLKDYVY